MRDLVCPGLSLNWRNHVSADDVQAYRCAYLHPARANHLPGSEEASSRLRAREVGVEFFIDWMSEQCQAATDPEELVTCAHG